MDLIRPRIPIETFPVFCGKRLADVVMVDVFHHSFQQQQQQQQQQRQVYPQRISDNLVFIAVSTSLRR